MKQVLGPSLTRGEKIAGFIFLPFYIFGIALALGLTVTALGLSLDDSVLNLIYFYICFICVLFIFHKFLKSSAAALFKSFFTCLQAVVLAFALFYVLQLILATILAFFLTSLSNPNNEVVEDLLQISPQATIVCAVLLGPLIEETLFRGLIFGTIRKKSRLLAYIVMYLAFAAIHLWQSALISPNWLLLVNALQYLPASLALGWCYEKSGNIWAPTALHMIINGITVATLLGLNSIL